MARFAKNEVDKRRLVGGDVDSKVREALYSLRRAGRRLAEKIEAFDHAGAAGVGMAQRELEDAMYSYTELQRQFWRGGRALLRSLEESRDAERVRFWEDEIADFEERHGDVLVQANVRVAGYSGSGAVERGATFEHSASDRARFGRVVRRAGAGDRGAAASAPASEPEEVGEEEFASGDDADFAPV